MDCRIYLFFSKARLTPSINTLLPKSCFIMVIFMRTCVLSQSLWFRICDQNGGMRVKLALIKGIFLDRHQFYSLTFRLIDICAAHNLSTENLLAFFLARFNLLRTAPEMSSSFSGYRNVERTVRLKFQPCRSKFLAVQTLSEQ